MLGLTDIYDMYITNYVNIVDVTIDICHLF